MTSEIETKIPTADHDWIAPAEIERNQFTMAPEIAGKSVPICYSMPFDGAHIRQPHVSGSWFKRILWPLGLDLPVVGDMVIVGPPGIIGTKLWRGMVTARYFDPEWYTLAEGATCHDTIAELVISAPQPDHTDENGHLYYTDEQLALFSAYGWCGYGLQS